MSSHSVPELKVWEVLQDERGLSENTFAGLTNMKLDGLAQDVAEASFFMVLTILTKNSRLLVPQKRLLEY